MQMTILNQTFDRRVTGHEVYRLHQEDLCQAFGLSSAEKYTEFEGGTVNYIVEFLRDYAKDPLGDIKKFAKILIYNYLIGNCDAHLKNYSICYALNTDKPSAGQSTTTAAQIKLAPAYDLVCTSIYERFSRDLAMRYGNKTDIDEIELADFDLLAKALHLQVDTIREMAEPIVSGLADAVMRAGYGEFDEVLDATAIVAEDLLEDFSPRIDKLMSWIHL